MIKITMQEVLHDAIQQIEHLQDSITDLTREPMLRSTKGTILLLEDVINSDVATTVIKINEANYTAPVVTKQELLVRLNDLVNVLDASIAEHGKYLTESIMLRLNESRETRNKAI